jgi:hypothetical protein
MKKFTINCNFQGQMSPFAIYLGTPEGTHHPLHFQSDWLGKERGGSIPPPIMEAITKLQNLAIKNNVSFEELCVYALGSFDVGAEKASEEGNENTEEEDEVYESDDLNEDENEDLPSEDASLNSAEEDVDNLSDLFQADETLQDEVDVDDAADVANTQDEVDETLQDENLSAEAVIDEAQGLGNDAPDNIILEDANDEANQDINEIQLTAHQENSDAIDLDKENLDDKQAIQENALDTAAGNPQVLQAEDLIAENQSLEGQEDAQDEVEHSTSEALADGSDATDNQKDSKGNVADKVDKNDV